MNETETYKKFKNSPKDNFPEFLIIHHSGGTDSNPLLDTSNHTAKDMEAWHLSKGWEGLGYQYVIHKNGDVWKGRPETYHGAHTTNYNTKSIGICMSGNFDATKPTSSQTLALVSLMKDIIKRYPNIQVKYHRDFAKKTCPGNNIGKDWAMDLLKVAEEEYVKIPRKLLVELNKYL